MIDALRAAVGDDHVLVDADVRASYETDWTRRFTGTALAVVRPGSTDEVAAVLRVCAARGVGIVPQGGNTGLVGGSVPGAGGDAVVVSLTRLTRVDPVDELAAEVTVGAGVTLARLQQHAARSGMRFAVDLAARDSATVGGMVATNAGGIHAFRHGPMRHQLVGIEAVLADGRVARRLPGLRKDNTGYDLPGLLAGSEGTLAIVTTVRVRLLPARHDSVVALAGLPDTESAQQLLLSLLATAANLEAAELFHEPGLRLVCEHARLPHPFAGTEHGAYLLVECATEDELEAAFGALGDGTGTAVGDDLWAYRERHTEAINGAGAHPPHKLDVTVPLQRLAEFERAVLARIGELDPHTDVYLFGHLGDGNVHVNLVGPAP
ncbi:MAG TPA: FAD-binding oxidoreductase, partial [Acidimicrobiales bacterium]|nr:FAD-binding oxidoreductase [Acidimicrobiales bacterium]